MYNTMCRIDTEFLNCNRLGIHVNHFMGSNSVLELSESKVVMLHFLLLLNKKNRADRTGYIQEILGIENTMKNIH